jgi:hypothetical protein
MPDSDRWEFAVKVWAIKATPAMFWSMMSIRATPVPD